MAKLWEVASGQEVAELVHPDDIKSITFSPKNTHLITVGYDQKARIWRVPQGELVDVLEHHNNTPAVAVSADGNYVALAVDEQTVQVWGIYERQEVVHFSVQDDTA